MYEKTVEKGHGRIETRECFVCSEIDWLAAAEKWVGLSGIGVIVSKKEEIDKEPTVSRSHFIFSLKNTTAAELMRIKISHWAVENNLHWVLDVAFREDDARARLGDAAENLTILRNCRKISWTDGRMNLRQNKEWKVAHSWAMQDFS